MQSMIFTNMNEVIHKLYELETLLNLTKESCQEKEFSSNYYNLQNQEKIMLSGERNNYINMLSVAQEKISTLKISLYNIESNIYKLK